MAQILCFGDSITQGYTDEFGGWTQRLRRYLDSKYVSKYADDIVLPAHDVFNLGISGATSSWLLKRLTQEVMPRLLGQQTIIVIAIGVNDSFYTKDTNQVECTVEQFAINLQALITRAREFTNDIVLVGTTPCEEAKMQPMPWSRTGKCYSNARLKMFNDEIVKCAATNNLTVVDVFDAIMNDDPHSYLADGVHPNEKGHTLLAYKIQQAVESLLVPTNLDIR